MSELLPLNRPTGHYRADMSELFPLNRATGHYRADMSELLPPNESNLPSGSKRVSAAMRFPRTVTTSNPVACQGTRSSSRL
jgi:hypothetical protein